MANAIKTVDELARWVNVDPVEAAAIESSEPRYKWRITPYYASIMDRDDPSCPIRQQAVPHHNEMVQFEGAGLDPVGDTYFRKTNRVIHKYPDRIILLVTQNCPVYCRHCTRKYHTTHKEGTYFAQGEGVSYEEDFQYIENHPEIRDVLLTGGDPLTYTDYKIEAILKRLRTISHVEIIRIGSRYPVLLPQRLTPDFCAMLEKYHPIWFSTHFNHPKELTPEAVKACATLLCYGVPVQNQTVLLKGINDDIATMSGLVTGLLKARVKPYYLYHCDNVSGVSHFATSVNKGREIMAGLLGHISGLALPRYIATTEIGKIPLERSYVHEAEGVMVLESYDGKRITLAEGLDNTPQQHPERTLPTAGNAYDDRISILGHPR